MRLPEWLSDLLWVLFVLALMLGFALVSWLAMEWMMRASVWYGRGPYLPSH